MNTNTLLAVIVGVVVVGGGAWYLSLQQPPAMVQEETTLSSAGTTTFASFVAQGGSRSCDIVVNNEAAPAQGVVYVSGADVRADFTTQPITAGGMSITAHMIQTGGYVYSWTDIMPQGVKVAVANGQGAASANGFDINAEVSYDCSAWTPDASKFEVPSTITFMEVNAQGEVQ